MAASSSPSQTHAASAASTGSSMATIVTRVAGTWCSADEHDERHDRPQDHDVREEEPDREADVVEPPEQRDAAVDRLQRKAPPRLEDRPEERGEDEAPGEQRVDVAAAGERLLRHEDVGRVRDRRDHARGDAYPVEEEPPQSSTTRVSPKG